MGDVLYERLCFGQLDVALRKVEAFAAAHIDFEPNLACERDRSGRRRWVVSVVRRTREEIRNGDHGDEGNT
jgi:hypothetical protein